MGNKKPTNCSECAYVQKDSTGMWCPFHDLAVSKTLVCDDFIDEYDSPQWNELFSEIKDETVAKPLSLKQRIKDITAYGLTVLLFLLCLFYIIMGQKGGL